MPPAELTPLVYAELRRLAAGKIAAELPGQTHDPTALVHEAWLKLADATGWADRTHFVRAAATAMRRVLVDRARGKRAVKRDGGRRVGLPDVSAPLPDDQVLALDEALTRLAAAKPDHARLLELRYFAGLTGDEAAAALGVSPATADRTTRRKTARQAARSVLPNATETKIMVTANARALRHFLEQRGSVHAEPEIRKLANMLLDVLMKDSPNLFGDYKKTPLPDGTFEITTEFPKV